MNKSHKSIVYRNTNEFSWPELHQDELEDIENIISGQMVPLSSDL